MGRFLKVAGLSDVGREREHNEDSYGLLPQYNLFVVADGMGGHRAGDVASQMAVKAVEDFFTDTEKEDITWPFHFDPNQPFAVNRLVTAIQVANSRIFKESQSNDDHQGMGTTMVAVHSVGGHQTGHIAHVGDSRCYRLRAGRLELMTMDHSLVNDYLRAAPDLTEEQLAELPRNVITRALGMQDTVTVDVQSVELSVGDVLLLCSDGLSGMVTDDESQDIILAQRDDLGRAAAALVERANEQGGEDNSTVVLIEVAEE
jgi:serine/threonine protein phosphatase PrpC